VSLTDHYTPFSFLRCYLELFVLNQHISQNFPEPRFWIVSG